MESLQDAASLADLGRETREASRVLAALSPEQRTEAVEQMAVALEESVAEIVAANREDLAAAEAEGLSSALYARLKLDEAKLASEIAGVRSVGRLPDPVGRRQIRRELDTNLILTRMTCPVGVLGVIFESRPDAAIQISALAVKSGNGAVLKGGREAERTCRAIMTALRRGLAHSAAPAAALQLLTTREEIAQLLTLDRYVDLIIPRGSNAFVRYVQDNTRIPVLGHADGICHLYIDRAANLDRAVALAVDAKVQYAAACNAIETLLVHSAIAPTFLPAAAEALREQGVRLLADNRAAAYIRDAQIATDADWGTEYLDLVLTVKTVGSLQEAIDHINTFGSRHTDAIATEDAEAARNFLSLVDSAGVYHNASTRFADGFRYGFGAEVGISTQKMPPRGPVGLEGLVTYKYLLEGTGQIVADYAGSEARPFTHRDLEE
ncbi:MAG: glutamate-5-semialdehyde dehydrogenase [Actinobacteria bacterium]|nr:glutamate-5-semialdehyde dehydrogenase [Actinomycetota bacterium]